MLRGMESDITGRARKDRVQGHLGCQPPQRARIGSQAGPRQAQGGVIGAGSCPGWDRWAHRGQQTQTHKRGWGQPGAVSGHHGQGRGHGRRGKACSSNTRWEGLVSHMRSTQRPAAGRWVRLAAADGDAAGSPAHASACQGRGQCAGAGAGGQGPQSALPLPAARAAGMAGAGKPRQQQAAPSAWRRPSRAAATPMADRSQTGGGVGVGGGGGGQRV
jgi:hypothetical protein